MNNTKQIPTQYDKCGEIIEEMAEDLIKKFHSHLVSANIAYLYCNKERKKNDKVILAKASKASPILKCISDYDFVIIIYYPSWVELTDSVQRAVLDHELCHCMIEEDEKTGEEKFKIIPHDFEEFGSVIKRHGFYSLDVKKIESTVESVKMKEILKD